MGAWIEIILVEIYYLLVEVAPHVGAWIEMSTDTPNFCKSTSHPTWVRGLKYGDERPTNAELQSHPTWVRGLKYVTRDVPYVSSGRTPRGCVD